MKLFKIIFLIAGLCFTIFSCSRDEIADDEQKTTSLPEGIEEETDYTWNTSDETFITLKGTSVTISGNGAEADGSNLTIKKPGNFRIKGQLENGQIKVNTDNEGTIRLILDGVQVSNQNTSPLFVDKAEKVILILADGSTNTITDGTVYSVVDEGQNAAIYSQAYLAVSGNGTLIVNGNYLDGINAKDGLVVKSGTINATAKDDGIRGKDFLYICGGNITVNAGGDGLKSDNESETSKGYVTILDGNFNVTSGGDGISAQTKLTITNGDFKVTSGGGSDKTVAATLSAKALKGTSLVSVCGRAFNLNTAEDGIHSDKEVIVKKGSFTISASDDGIHSDQTIVLDSADISITKSKEGVEAKFITVNSGTISVVSNDDSFNSTNGARTEQNDGSCTYINGGTLILNATAGDPLDSNGSIEMKGGTVVIHGPKSQPEVAIDYNGTFNLSSGFLVASGPSQNMFQGVSTTSAQKSLKLLFKSTLAANTLFHIEDSNGNELVTFSPSRSFLTIVFSSPEIEAGKTYKIFTGGTSTGTNMGGLKLNGIYSGGTLRTSVIPSSSVTSLTVN